MSETQPRIGVVRFEAATDALQTIKALARAGATVVELEATDTQLDVDAVVLPGGFSSGDYLRAGALAARTPIMAALKTADVPVLGTGNGFQVLLEAGLLPGAMLHNDGVNYVHTDVNVRIDDNNTAFTGDYDNGEEITLVHKAAWANYLPLSEDVRVIASYTSSNPNGSAENIAAVANAEGTVVGIAVHPEYAIEEGFGTDSAEGPGMGVDGVGVFTSIMNYLAKGSTRAN